MASPKKKPANKKPDPKSSAKPPAPVAKPAPAPAAKPTPAAEIATPKAAEPQQPSVLSALPPQQSKASPPVSTHVAPGGAPSQATPVEHTAADRRKMIETAAYFLAEKDRFQRSEYEYWLQAEQQVARDLTGR